MVGIGFFPRYDLYCSIIRRRDDTRAYHTALQTVQQEQACVHVTGPLTIRNGPRPPAPLRSCVLARGIMEADGWCARTNQHYTIAR